MISNFFADNVLADTVAAYEGVIKAIVSFCTEMIQLQSFLVFLTINVPKFWRYKFWLAKYLEMFDSDRQKRLCGTWEMEGHLKWFQSKSIT